MAPDWWWGEIPEGFRKAHLGGTRTIAVRESAERHLSLERLTVDRSGEGEESRFHGRGRLRVLKLGDGTSALVRVYRHGGALRALTGNLFFTWPPRPMRELSITEAARKRGVRTVEILAAGVERVCGPLYRGWLVTREIQGARDVWAIVQGDDCTGGSKYALLESVAHMVRSMHRSGVYHRDLNLKNILVRRESERLEGYIIDLDKSRMFPDGVPQAMAEKNLARLGRSIRKLDPAGRRLSGSDWDLFLKFYREAGGG
jgi:tRNA A-37 threonylcarbamoyl transferase component Bud32